MKARIAACMLTVLVSLPRTDLSAHAGPPFPIVTDRVAGPYLISLWTDPDTTDDGSPGGQFWVMMSVNGSSTPVPEATRAIVTAMPVNRSGPTRTGSAMPVNGTASTQFAGLVLEDEGRFEIRIAIDGPLGRADVRAEVDATYDARPSPLSILVYVMPFVLIGGLWTRLLLRRRRAVREGARRRDSNSA